MQIVAPPRDKSMKKGAAKNFAAPLLYAIIIRACFPKCNWRFEQIENRPCGGKRTIWPESFLQQPKTRKNLELKHPATCQTAAGRRRLRTATTTVATMPTRLMRSATRQNQKPTKRMVTVPLYPAGSTAIR